MCNLVPIRRPMFLQACAARPGLLCSNAHRLLRSMGCWVCVLQHLQAWRRQYA